MASMRMREWARVAAVLSLAAMVGCMKDKSSSGSSSSGAGAPSPLLWNQPTGPSISGGTYDTPLLWVDPNTNIGGSGGAGGNVISIDERTYGAPVDYNTPNKSHPLQTATGSLAITTPEDTVSGMLNGYRQQVLGIGAGGGLIGGGGIPIGGNQGILVPMHATVRKIARAHSKHYSRFVPGVALPNQNQEGDWAGTQAPGPQPVQNPPNPPKAGRLAKCNVTYGSYLSAPISGQGYGTPDSFRDWCIQNTPVTAAWTHWGIGYYIGGTEQHYWNIVYLTNPVPSN